MLGDLWARVWLALAPQREVLRSPITLLEQPDVIRSALSCVGTARLLGTLTLAEHRVDLASLGNVGMGPGPGPPPAPARDP